MSRSRNFPKSNLAQVPRLKPGLGLLLLLLGSAAWGLAQSDAFFASEGTMTDRSMKWGYPADQTGHFLTSKEVGLALNEYCKAVHEAQKVGYEIRDYPNWKETREALIKGEINLIIIPSLQLHNELGSLPCRPFLTPLIGTKNQESYSILVRKDSGIETTEDLRGRPRLEYIHGPPAIIQTWYLKTTGQLDRSIEQDTIPVSSPNKAMFPVFFHQKNQPEVCVVPTFSYEVMKELNPAFGKDIRVIATSPRISLSFMCVRTPTELDADMVSKTLRDMIETEAGKQNAALTRSSSMLKFEDAHLDGIREIMQGIPYSPTRELKQ